MKINEFIEDAVIAEFDDHTMIGCGVDTGYRVYKKRVIDINPLLIEKSVNKKIYIGERGVRKKTVRHFIFFKKEINEYFAMKIREQYVYEYTMSSGQKILSDRDINLGYLPNLIKGMSDEG